MEKDPRRNPFRSSEAGLTGLIQQPFLGFLWIFKKLGSSNHSLRDHIKNELDPAEAPTLRAIDRVKDQLIKAMANSPGHHLRARQMTPWGVIQGMTNVVDFQLPTQVSSSIKGVDQRKFAETNNRLSRSWFGSGQTLKEIAWREGVRYLKAA